ncbi:MAG: peptide chain release factor N(5)-glutamine methyltransferase [Sphingobacteriales bacterium]|nr:MAG: peptide chain release factor N(5)-glutamine methyltransferase [Sphingobacteriales bacterium]
MPITYNDAFYQLLAPLKLVYDEREAAAIAHEALEHLTGLKKLDRIIKKDEQLSDKQQLQYEIMKTDLAAGKPLQYVTGTAWFMGRPFKVDSNVLIPRPETEELVSWIAGDYFKQSPELLDIGTGSGCIPISLKLALPDSIIYSCDVSADALAIAEENAGRLEVEVELFQLDFLNEAQREVLSAFDVIVSNPPYIPQSEAANIHTNVKDHEPHLALFVPNDDPLLFYRAIASFGKTHLKSGGAIYCELHADHAKETEELFRSKGYGDVTLRTDMHGNPRMLKALL